MQPNHHVEAIADVVHVVPGTDLDCSKCGGEGFARPASEAFDALLRFIVRGRLG